MGTSTMTDSVAVAAMRECGPQRLVNTLVAKHGLDRTLQHVEVACHTRAQELKAEGVDLQQGESWSAAAVQLATVRAKSRHVRGL